MARYIFWIGIILLVIIRYVTNAVNFKDGEKVRITTTITSEPIYYDTTQRIKINGLFVYLPLFPQLNYGDKLVVEGLVQNSKLENPKVITVEKAHLPLSALRSRLIDFINTTLPQPYSGLISGIVFGSKSNLSSDFWGKLKNTGTAHVVVASGSNVTFFAAALFGCFLPFINRRRAVIVAIGGVWFYCLIAGFDAPVIRAGIMASIAFAAQLTGRISVALQALLISAGLMLVINPLWFSDLGFILSFAATGSILLLDKKVYTKLWFVPKVLRESISTSLSAQIGVAPILLVAFGQFNILSPVINALVLWSVPLIMFLGLVASFISILIPPLGVFILQFVFPLAWWFTEVINLFSP